MAQVSVAEAKSSLSELIKRVEEGEEIVITRHGREVATLSKVKREGPRQLGVLGHFALEPGWGDPIPEEDWESLRGVIGGIDIGTEK